MRGLLYKALAKYAGELSVFDYPTIITETSIFYFYYFIFYMSVEVSVFNLV